MGMGKKNNPFEGKFIDFSTWPQASVDLYRESVRETINAIEIRNNIHCMRGQAIISINGVALAFLITAIGLIENLQWWVLLFVIPLLISLFFALYTFTITARELYVTDIWAGANPVNRPIFTNTLLHKEDYLNGLIRICNDIREDSKRRGLFVAISGILFFVALCFLLVGISSMVWPDTFQWLHNLFR